MYSVVVALGFRDNYASALGLIYSFCTPGGLLGPVISGIIFDRSSVYVNGVRTTNYAPLAAFGGSMMLLGAAVAAGEVVVLQKSQREKSGVRKWVPV